MKNRGLQAICLAGVLSIVLTGCTTAIPDRLEVRDVGSGRTYQTYKPWGEVEKGVGFSFVDIETGRRVNLTNYEVRTLEGKKDVGNDTPEAKAFKAAKERGGVK